MANSLLDFVMALVRDPDAAARYAADPSQAISDAHLVGVTSVDVNNLIPVVSESLTSPTGGDGFGDEPAGNVWASGAATAAFDAFGDHTPFVADTGHTVDHVITEPDHVEPAAVDGFFTDPGLTAPPLDDSSLQLSDSVIDDAPAIHTDLGTDWTAPTVDEHHHDDGGAAFDMFS
ncbi:Rv0340 family IniB-related protein [Mycobacterium sp. 141]|uniref:Rv0340 family IniB-related protein n=1 Tax=Mycobacterium sp. 141 TaxID=1120797 RepID=UPI0003A23EF9|nr:IniB N-terminal domain-containing protein [Mycobacterium sp. 141]